MKLEPLIPKVDTAHESFSGYKAGEAIGDHDVALAYVLERYPDALPSFVKLPKVQQESVRFTQSKMEYNMGWLVQAEAPPGALFSKFREIIRAGGARPEDVAFYFTHWFTDLAGAEPCPQEGCEKFVLKFPQKVFQSFLNSFSIVKELSLKTETEVYEDYLQWRWDSSGLGESHYSSPEGFGSIAKMRLVVMAQGDSQRIVDDFDMCSPSIANTLSAELARTGCAGQTFRRDSPGPGGPAILVYYGPALMQKAGAIDPKGAMAVLADVLRKGRTLFPLSAGNDGETVTIRIDALKNLLVKEIFSPQGVGDIWLLKKTSEVDAQVVKGNYLSDGLPNHHVDGLLLFTEADTHEPGRSSVYRSETHRSETHRPKT
jgi:hypothetical protein